MKKLPVLIFICLSISRSCQEKSKSPWTCATKSGQCALPFVDGTLSYKTCASTSESRGYAWCPLKKHGLPAGPSIFEAGVEGQDWEYCGSNGNGEEPYDCTYDDHHNTCGKSHPFSYNNGTHCCATKASSCPDRCSNFLEWDFPVDCCPEEERKECNYHRCSDYFEGGCLEHHAAYPMNDIGTYPMISDLNTCREECVANRQCKVFTWRSPDVCRLKTPRKN